MKHVLTSALQAFLAVLLQEALARIEEATEAALMGRPPAGLSICPMCGLPISDRRLVDCLAGLHAPAAPLPGPDQPTAPPVSAPSDGSAASSPPPG